MKTSYKLADLFAVLLVMIKGSKWFIHSLETIYCRQTYNNSAISSRWDSKGTFIVVHRRRNASHSGEIV